MSSVNGVLVVAHGTVTRQEDLPAFLTRIRRGRPPSEGLVREMRERYERIGGSPLLSVTRAQAQELTLRLDLPVSVAMRFWEPTIEQVLPDVLARGVRRLCVLPLAPFSVSVYYDAVLAASQTCTAETSLELLSVSPWGTEPGFVNSWVRRIREAESSLPAAHTEVVLTAHSLPTRTITGGDLYEVEFREAADAVMRGLGRPCLVAYQSQGADGGDWLGPDLATTFRSLRERGTRRVITAPLGFPSEHVETLYDLDVEAKQLAEQLGLEFVRVKTLNTDDDFMETLGRVVRRSFEQAGVAL